MQFPFRGLWALLHTVDDADGGGGAPARHEAAGAQRGQGALLNGICLELASAVVVGRSGQGDEATAVVEANLVDGLTRGADENWRSVLLALVASAALRHGWGHGDRWALQALARFEATGMNELASWCRAMLRDAGRPVPRRGRGVSAPSAGLRALGVTSRESDVLEVLATGATNNEIAARLHLSPRTVERHVSNLLTKTGAADRRDLARRAASASSATA